MTKAYISQRPIYPSFSGPDGWVSVFDIKDSMSNPGYKNLITAGGSVISAQPDGHLELRAAGTDGPYEQFQIFSNAAVSDYSQVHGYYFIS